MTWSHLLILLVTVVAMEPLVALFHRYVMHGPGWRWHESHHHPEKNRFERNDLYAILASFLTLLLFIFAEGSDHASWWIALGISVYGLLYALVHDGLVHKRFPFPGRSRNAWLRRLVEAHHLHHATRERHGGVSYGFLYAPPVRKLRERLKAQRG